MQEGFKNGRTNCRSCGQLLGFEITEQWRKTKKIICPVCKKVNWVLLDTADNCLFRLSEYEETGMEPKQVAALLILMNEARKYPELEKFLDDWEARLDDIKGKSNR